MERALRNLEDIKGIYKDVSPLQAKDSQVWELKHLEAKLVNETEARQKSASRVNCLQKQIEM